jgi:two-component system chemotaxis response regulator CheY
MIELGNLKILIVDDEKFTRLTTRTVLLAVGRFTVTEADSGDGALAEIARTEPDVVLCDIAMPRMDGLRFVDLLRNHSEIRLRDTAVIMLTGHADAATVAAASRLNINGYMIKPISPKQLGDQLRKILIGRRFGPPA